MHYNCLIGAFGTVYKGIVTVQTDDTPELIDVAVKTINEGTYLYKVETRYIVSL